MSAIKRISDRALAQLKKRYQPSDFRPTFKGYNMYGKPIYKKPKVSLRMLNVMRKNLDYLQRDPTSIGLPIKPEKRPPRLKKPKRPKYERDAPKRIVEYFIVIKCDINIKDGKTALKQFENTKNDIGITDIEKYFEAQIFKKL
ncbi:11212_t:CDS:2, partial [Entrophospora sp. SA101]